MAEEIAPIPPKPTEYMRPIRTIGVVYDIYIYIYI